MGNITISLDKEDEKKLRHLAKEKYSDKKGGLSRVVAEGIGRLDHELEAGQARQHLIQGMEKGFNMGKWRFKHRGELYER